MNRFKICQFIVIRIDADAEKESGVSTIDDFCTAFELDEIGLVFLVSRSDEAVDLALKLHFLIILVA